MRPGPVPVTLPRARFAIDQDGHLAVTVDDRPWQPPTPNDSSARAGGVPLGRSDVAWAQEQIAEALDTPVVVHLVDGGQAYEPYFVVPDSYRPLEPNSLSDTAIGETARVGEPGLGRLPGGKGEFTPGESVALMQVVGRAVADEHGAVHFRLPAALGDRTRALLVQGQVSGTTVPYDDLTQRSGDSAPANTAPGSARAPGPAAPAISSSGIDARRTSGRRPAPAPGARHTPAAPDVPDAGWGAL